MQNAKYFMDKIKRGEICLGTNISFFDPTAGEALCRVLDFLWIDMEHNPMSPETVQANIMATKGTQTTSLVRVAWNDPVLVKPVLDMGADGIVFPLVRTADDVRLAVSACLYPPEGIRGYGPRRASNFGGHEISDYVRVANETVIIIVQIEHIEAVRNIEEILAVPRLTSILIGSNDLSGSMGLLGQPRHPDVLREIDTVLEKARQAGIPVGVAIGDDVATLNSWVDKGVSWLSAANDTGLLLRGTFDVMNQVREHARSRSAT